jgi:hypothetical protein
LKTSGIFSDIMPQPHKISLFCPGYGFTEILCQDRRFPEVFFNRLVDENAVVFFMVSEVN